MKKVGILTYHKSYNYGAMLQAYALRITISKLGFDSEVIDYGSIGKGNIFSWSMNSFKSICGSCVNNTLKLFGEKERRSKFCNFSETAIGTSDKTYPTRQDLLKDIELYDYLITGSDQVWHPLISEGDLSYFLNFPIPSFRKISYAASFGVSTLTDSEIEKYSPCLKDIGHLSVREEEGVELLRTIVQKEAKLVIDPTFLCERDEWERISISPKIKKKYILFFTILGDPEGSEIFTRELSKKTGYSIVKIGSIRDLIKRGYRSRYRSGPKEFLGLIQNAEIVVTNSFHGTAFSIIFQKNFYTFLNNNDRNSRLTSITNQLGLQNRIKKGVTPTPPIEEIVIDYSPVLTKLAKLKQESLQFLKQALNE